MNTTLFPIAHNSKSQMPFMLVLVAVIIAIPVMMLLNSFPMGAVTFTVSNAGITISGDPYGTTIERSHLRTADAQRIDISIESKFALLHRTNGTGLPDYQAGWFETKAAGKALEFIADPHNAVVVPTDLGYTLIVSPDNSDAFLASLRASPSLSENFLLASDDNDKKGMPKGKLWLSCIVMIIPLFTVLLLFWLYARSKKTAFEISSDSLRICGDFYGRSIARSALQIGQASIVDISSGDEKISLIRTNGLGLPGYLSGWCRNLHSGEKFLTFITDKTRVVRIPTSEGYTLLISPEAPENFLAVLR